MKEYIASYVNTCKICQKYKTTARKGYGILPAKDNMDSTIPWWRVYTDTIGTWEICVADTEDEKKFFESYKKLTSKML